MWGDGATGTFWNIFIVVALTITLVVFILRVAVPYFRSMRRGDTDDDQWNAPPMT